MKTSGLIKVISAKNITSIVHYNTRTSKTIGRWRNQDNVLHQNDLVGFYGNCHYPGTLKQQANAFIRQVKSNASLCNVNYKYNFSLVPWPKSFSMCHTVVQSFDYKANPNLNPVKVHRMGIEMLQGLQNYFNYQYHYKLDGGLVSTHIDDDHEQYIKGQIHHTHLHNHIIIPSFNSQGLSISPYLRKHDLYCFQNINDNITMLNNLKDYHFLKLKRLINPNSSFTKTNTIKGNHHSHLQKAVIRFTKANNEAFDKYPTNFFKAKKYRNHNLQITWNYQTRTKKDVKNHKPQHQFTMLDFHNKNQQMVWYNLNNLSLLLWRNKKEEQCERFIRQFQFKYDSNRAVSYQTFAKTMTNATKYVPPIETLTSDKARHNHQVVVTVPKEKVKIINHIQTPKLTWQKYLQQLNLDKQWKQIPQSGHVDFRVGYLIKDIQKNNKVYVQNNKKRKDKHIQMFHVNHRSKQISNRKRKALKKYQSNLSW